MAKPGQNGSGVLRRHVKRCAGHTGKVAGEIWRQGQCGGQGVAAVRGGCAGHHERSECSPATVLLAGDVRQQLLEGVIGGVERLGDETRRDDVECVLEQAVEPWLRTNGYLS